MRETALSPESVVFANGHLVLLLDSSAPELLVHLAPGVIGRFERSGEERSVVSSTRLGRFVLRSTLQAHSPIPHPAASLRGVLWRRQAAIAIDQQPVASPQAARQTLESSLESARGSRRAT